MRNFYIQKNFHGVNSLKDFDFKSRKMINEANELLMRSFHHIGDHEKSDFYKEKLPSKYHLRIEDTIESDEINHLAFYHFEEKEEVKSHKSKNKGRTIKGRLVGLVVVLILGIISAVSGTEDEIPFISSNEEVEGKESVKGNINLKNSESLYKSLLDEYHTVISNNDLEGLIDLFNEGTNQSYVKDEFDYITEEFDYDHTKTFVIDTTNIAMYYKAYATEVLYDSEYNFYDYDVFLDVLKIDKSTRKFTERDLTYDELRELDEVLFPEIKNSDEYVTFYYPGHMFEMTDIKALDLVTKSAVRKNDELHVTYIVLNGFSYAISIDSLGLEAYNTFNEESSFYNEVEVNKIIPAKTVYEFTKVYDINNIKEIEVYALENFEFYSEYWYTEYY
jgi:hypothetical protein